MKRMKRLLFHVAPHAIWLTILALAIAGWAHPSGNQEGGFVVKRMGDKWQPHVIRMAPIAIEGETMPEGIDAKSAGGWQPTECRGPTECLARIYFHEHEQNNRPDQQLIFHVLARVAGSDRPSLRAMKAYSSRATGIEPPRSDRTRWIAQLRLDGTRPPAYDRSEPWTDARPRWLAAARAARADLRSPPPPPSCRFPAQHWGGWNIDDRSDDGWVESECEGTLNRGWCDPALGECREEEAEEPVAADERPGASPNPA